MRFLVSCVALAAVAAAASTGTGQTGNPIPELFHGQREYVYNYRSLVGTGLPLQSTRYSGLEKFGVLTIQVQEQQGDSKTLALRLGHVTAGSFDKEVEDIENRRVEGVAHAADETIERYGPVFVKYTGNEVQKLMAPPRMPEEIVNVYRGIAAALTVGKPETHGGEHPFMLQGGHGQGHGEPVVYRRHEHGIVGNFETYYEILSDTEQNHYMNITKTKNYMNQIGRDGRFFRNGHDERGCQNVCPVYRPVKVENNMQPEMSDWNKPVAEGCPVKFHPKNELVEAYTTYGYNVTLEQGGKYGLINEIHGLDKKVLPLRQQQILTVSVLRLSFVQTRPISTPWPKQGDVKNYDDLTYRFPEGHQYDLPYLALYGKQNNGDMLKEQIVPMIKALANIIVSDNLELKGQTGDKIVQLVRAIGALRKQELQALWGVYGQTGNTVNAGAGNTGAGNTATEVEYVQRKVFIDTVALSGSNEAAQFLLGLIHQQKLTTLETVHTLETFQKNIVHPTTQTLTQLLNVCTGQKFQEERLVFSTACIALGEAVRAHCGQHTIRRWTPYHGGAGEHGGAGGHGGIDNGEHGGAGGDQHYNFCTEQEYKHFVETIRGQLTSAKDFAQQAVYIQTLGRLSHPDAIKTLVPYVFGEREVVSQIEKMNRNDKAEDNSEYTQFVRQVAIFALHHSVNEYGDTIQPIVQSIYFDKEEDYELRIAALSVLLATQPTESTYGRIVLELPHEHNQEVASYAYSALRSIANSTLPCMRQSARRVQNVLGGLPEKTFGFHHSKWFTYAQYYPMSHIGVKGHWEAIQSNVSYVPRAFYTGFTANKGPFVSTVGDFGFYAKGFENLDNYIHQHGGMNKIVENVMQRIRRDARNLAGEGSVKQMLEHIEQAMQFNTEEENEQPRAVVFGNYLGNEVYVPIGKEYLTKVAKTAGEQIIKILREEGTDKTFRYVRVLMPRTYVQVAPGVNGLPVVMVNRHPIVVTLALKDFKTRFGGEKGQFRMYPFVFAASGLIKPTVYHTSVHTAKVIYPVGPTPYSYGVHATEQTYFTLPLDVAVQYTHQTKTVGFTIRPRFEQVFYHKTRVATFKTEALLIHSVDKPMLEHFTTIKTQSRPMTIERVLGEKLGMTLRVQGLTTHDDYNNYYGPDNNYFGPGNDYYGPGYTYTGEYTIFTQIFQKFANQWFFPRTWSIRVEQGEYQPIEEIKVVVRVGTLFGERLEGNNGQKQLSQEQLVKEQAYPEYMRMIAFDREYEKTTGRKPETEKLEQAVERIAKQTEKFWSPVDSELGRKINKDNTQVRSIEYVLTCNGQKKQQLAVTGHMILAHTLTKQAKLAEIKMNVENQPIYLEAQGVAAFTKAPQPFETEVREQEQRGVLGFVANLETAETGKQQFNGKLEMTKSEEQKRVMARPVDKKPWFYRQCQQDKKQQLAEMSTACEALRHHKAALNMLNFEIQLPQKINGGLLNVTHKAREALKVILYNNLQANYFNKNGQQDKLEGEIIFSERDPEMTMVNMTLRTPDQEELRFERVALPKTLRPNTMWSVNEQIMAVLRNGRPEPVCVYNGRNIRTFDNVTYSLDTVKTGEEYVIVRDNNDKSKFTIVGKKLQGGEHPETELTIMLGEATYLKLVPSKQNGHYKVYVNNTEHDITSTKTTVNQYAGWGNSVITMHLDEHKEGQATLVVFVRDQGLGVVYDGKNFKVMLGRSQFKGQVVGLCGNMNNEYENEFVGPRGCQYDSEGDFVRVYGLNQQGEIKGEWTCPEGVVPRGASKDAINKIQQQKSLIEQQKQLSHQQRDSLREGHKGIFDETRIITVGGKMCFSVEPLPTCRRGFRPVNTELRSVGFTCMTANHPLTIQIQREVQLHGIASNLPSQYGESIYHDVEIATACVRQ